MCDACTKASKKKGKSNPPCEVCQYAQPEILEENRPVIWFLNQYSGLLWDGMGGFNANAFELCMKMAGMPDGMKAEIINGVMIFKMEMSEKD